MSRRIKRVWQNNNYHLTNVLLNAILTFVAISEREVTRTIRRELQQKQEVEGMAKTLLILLVLLELRYCEFFVLIVYFIAEGSSLNDLMQFLKILDTPGTIPTLLFVTKALVLHIVTKF